MMEADKEFRMAASRYRQAEQHFKDTEAHLRRWLARLEGLRTPAAAPPLEAADPARPVAEKPAAAVS